MYSAWHLCEEWHSQTFFFKFIVFKYVQHIKKEGRCSKDCVDYGGLTTFLRGVQLSRFYLGCILVVELAQPDIPTIIFGIVWWQATADYLISRNWYHFTALPTTLNIGMQRLQVSLLSNTLATHVRGPELWTLASLKHSQTLAWNSVLDLCIGSCIWQCIAYFLPVNARILCLSSKREWCVWLQACIWLFIRLAVHLSDIH